MECSHIKDGEVSKISVLPPVAYLTREIAKVSVPDGGLSLSRVVLFGALDK